MLRDNELPYGMLSGFSFKLVVFRGSGPSPEGVSLSTILNAAGEREGAAEVMSTAFYWKRKWHTGGTSHQNFRTEMC